jgi:hypothetical protein
MTLEKQRLKWEKNYLQREENHVHPYDHELSKEDSDQ